MSATEGGDTNGGGRISVSRDALRAELAELKLGLMTELNAALDRKASQASVDAVDRRVYEISRRTDVLEDKSRETTLVAEALLNDKRARWTTREKVVAFGFAALTILLNIASLGPDVIRGWK